MIYAYLIYKYRGADKIKSFFLKSFSSYVTLDSLYYLGIAKGNLMIFLVKCV